MDSIIPENIKGKSLDIEHHITKGTIEEASKAFERACARLTNPSVWHSIAGELSAKFTLYNTENENDRKVVKVGDYISIDVPGPGIEAGYGFDWVQVELLQNNVVPYCDEGMAMRLRASKNPSSKDDSIAHFFNYQATSSFIIKRMGKTVFASYHGRNEMANTAEISFIDKLRNMVVAAGAEAGVSNLQWEALIKGLLQPETEG